MTAAPGPQQPDEECARACAWHNGLYWHETFCPCWRRGLSLCSCAQKTLPAAPSAQPDERPCDCVTPLPAGSLFYMGSHHQPGCVFYHAPAPAQPVRDTEEGRR